MQGALLSIVTSSSMGLVTLNLVAALIARGHVCAYNHSLPDTDITRGGYLCRRQ